MIKGLPATTRLNQGGAISYPKNHEGASDAAGRV
jgi:hypothetical protein